MQVGGGGAGPSGADTPMVDTLPQKAVVSTKWHGVAYGRRGPQVYAPELYSSDVTSDVKGLSHSLYKGHKTRDLAEAWVLAILRGRPVIEWVEQARSRILAAANHCDSMPELPLGWAVGTPLPPGHPFLTPTDDRAA